MVERDDEIREHCRRQGYSMPVIRGGLERLVGQWEAVAASLAAQESQYYDDYLNDMDGRKILAEVLPLASEEQRTSVEARVSSADATVRAHTEETEECIWGSEPAAKHGWSPHVDWWYYRRPKALGADWD